MPPHAKDAERYRVDDPHHFRLKHVDPGDTGSFRSKAHAKEELKAGIERMLEDQEKLYAQDRWALLLVFQAMDAAGKDSTIKHVMSGVNPQGCEVHSFKAPSSEELDHDYLWRSMRALPQRGRIGIFNRSHYEEVLVVRVHRDVLAKQKIPPQLVTPDIWRQRFDDINAFEQYLTHNGVIIRKFFLHVSREEQRQRFLERLEQSEKNWKFSLLDVNERDHWDDYMKAYEDMIRHTSTPEAPWYVVPADHKWFTRVVVSQAIVATLEGLQLAYPKVDAARKKELEQVRRALENEGAIVGKRSKNRAAGRARSHGGKTR
jgi:PPK2 family polyphosphate:nucleotide phosphotransferase